MLTSEMPITIAANPRLVYPGRQLPTLIVIHDAECPCAPGKARAVAEYFAGSLAGGAAHYTVDPAATAHSIAEQSRAAHCGWPGNRDSVGIEMCGYAADKWDDQAHVATWKRAADLARDIAGRWSIPLTYRSAADLKAGRSNGWTYHKDVTAGLGGTTHTDPGPNFPHQQFKEYLERSTTATTQQAPSGTWSTIRRGSSGVCVVLWTTWIHAMFSYANKVSPGNYMGNDATEATCEFQRRVGVDDDGVVGPLTIAKAVPLGFKY
jgi:hypothetical protein